MKLKKFPVSGAQGEVLNWSMGLFLAFSAVNLADHYRGVRFATEQQRNPDCRSSTAAIDKTGDVGNTTQESEEE